MTRTMTTSTTAPAGWDPAARLLTAAEAAASVGRPAGTVRRWVAERRLRPVARRTVVGRRGEDLVLEADVLAVDAAARAAQPGAAARRRAAARALELVPPDVDGLVA